MKKSTTLKSDTSVFEEHLAQMGTYDMYYNYLNLLRAFCDKLPEAQLELVVCDPFEESGWSRCALIEDEITDYQVRLWLRGKPTKFIVPLIWLEQISVRMSATFHVDGGFIRHLTFLEKLEEILQWVALWEFCDHCSRVGAGATISHEQFLVTYQGEPVQVKELRVIRNSVRKEYWWVLLEGPKGMLSKQLVGQTTPKMDGRINYDSATSTLLRLALTDLCVTRVE